MGLSKEISTRFSVYRIIISLLQYKQVEENKKVETHKGIDSKITLNRKNLLTLAGLFFVVKVRHYIFDDPINKNKIFLFSK